MSYEADGLYSIYLCSEEMNKTEIKKLSKIQKLYARLQRYQMFFYTLIPFSCAFALITYKNGIAPIWSYYATLALTGVVLVWAWGSFIWTLKQKFEALETPEEKQKAIVISFLVIVCIVAAVMVGRWFVHDYMGWGDMYTVFWDRLINP